MRHFDREQTIQHLSASYGIRMMMSADIEEATANRCLWWVSRSLVNDAVRCILCDMMDPAHALIAKARLWMDRAISTGEESTHFEGACVRYHHQLYSMIRWLQEGMHDQASLDVWRNEASKWYSQPGNRGDLHFVAEVFLDAGAYEDFIRLCDPAGGMDGIKCSAANAKQMGLTLAAQALTGKFPEAKVQASVKKFLDNYVGERIANGDATAAAAWMKVIYWKRGQAGLTPFEAVRKCLDHVEL